MTALQHSSAEVTGKRTRTILLSIIGLVTVAAVFTVVFSARLVTAMQNPSSDTAGSDAATHFVVVAGTWADHGIAEQVYRGVQSVAPSLNCAVELHVPSTSAQDVPVSQLLEYASFACADGVILINSDETLALTPLTDVHGTEIPLITVGQWSASNREISCISSNYYSMGKSVVRALLQHQVDSLLIISDSSHAHNGVTSLSSSMQESYNSLGATLPIDICIVDTPSPFATDDLLRKKISETDADGVLCVTPELTSLVAQTLIDTERSGDLKLLGLYQTERTREYVQKGLVAALITPRIELMGQYAIEEMASYLTTGYCNSYRQGVMQLVERSNVQ
ncbi:MAG: substrate-binding domain-containing protein [Treponemataceae bacterium]|nr:substrate-binding domain-containing protein [Treponemataceae bacterium]